MRAIEYALREAGLSLWRNRGSSLLATVAIALAVLVLGGVMLVAWNAERWLEARTADAELSVFLADGATEAERRSVERALDGSGVVARRTFVSKAEALARFRATFADLAPLAEEFDDNPFPASIEGQLVATDDVGARAARLVTAVGRMPGVVDVRYDREWLRRLEQALGTLRALGALLAAVLALAAAVTVATVVRLGLYARRAELEIMTLVGSPVAFIRGPFVAEGLLQGGLGAALALLLVWVGYRVAVQSWGSSLAGLLEGARIVFLPWAFCGGLLLGGMLVGAVGGFVASRHADA